MPTTEFSRSVLERIIAVEPQLERDAYTLGIDIDILDNTVAAEVTTERPDLLTPFGLARAINNYRGHTQTYQISESAHTDGNAHPNASSKQGREIIASFKEYEPAFIEIVKNAYQKIVETHGRRGRKAAIQSSIMTPHGLIALEEIDEEKTLPTRERGPLIIATLGFGESPETVDDILRIVACDAIDAGATVATRAVRGDSMLPPLFRERTIVVNHDYLTRVLGRRITPENLHEHLARTGLRTDGHSVSIPPYRADIRADADIAGEIVTANGLDAFRNNALITIEKQGVPIAYRDRAEACSDAAARLGLIEVKNLLLGEPEILREYCGAGELIGTGNAKSIRHSAARPSLIPGLIETIRANKHQPKPLRLFESGATAGITDGKPWEEPVWGYAMTGPTMGFAYAKSILSSVLQQLRVPWTIEATERPYYLPGRAASIMVHGQEAGHIGEIHPRLLERAGIEDPLCTGELLMRKI